MRSIPQYKTGGCLAGPVIGLLYVLVILLPAVQKSYAAGQDFSVTRLGIKPVPGGKVLENPPCFAWGPKQGESRYVVEVYKLRGRLETQKYIIKEIQYVYSSQGQPLNDKHVEIIAKQMFSRIYVSGTGETDLLPG
ncbi:MAG: hypothetical protein U9P14_10300, partial [Gemmatimonadota bacterium]|nr:hypothetical protein [Gemmatimonadota bacterium]